MLAGRRAWLAAVGGVRDGSGVAERPHVIDALDAHLGVDADATCFVEREPEALDRRRRLDRMT
jgi:hypothetical protein